MYDIQTTIQKSCQRVQGTLLSLWSNQLSLTERCADVQTTLSKIENACDDVKMSVRLKKVLKTILKVGNQMNDGEAHAGFTLDSLLKLQSAKAFDKKTSILQYVIMLIYRNDENCLLFPDDLQNVSIASRLTLDSVVGEASMLRAGLDTACKVVTEIRSDETSKAGSTGTMASFLVKVTVFILKYSIRCLINKFQATQKCDELDSAIEKVDYFGSHTRSGLDFNSKT